jgi:hypothetical protein
MAENIEVAVARIDERVTSHDSIIKDIATDLKSIARAYEELAKSNQRVSLLEQEVINLKDAHKELWKRLDANEKEQRKITIHAIYDFLKLAVAVGVGALLDKVGIHLP